MRTRYGPFRRAGLLGACVGGLILALGFAGVAVAAPIPVTPLAMADVFAAAVFDPTPILVQGTNRYTTAVEASKLFASADIVVVATGEAFPDALGGAALAGAVGGPLLLTPPASVPTYVLSEIDRLGASTIYVLGGTGAVSANAFDQLNDAIAGTPIRLGGLTRYETAALVAEETIDILGEGWDGGVFLATGLNFPDALAAGPIAAAMGRPIVLVNAAGDYDLPTGVDYVDILGGTGVVSQAVEDDLGDYVNERLAGIDRYATAREVAEYGVSLGMVWNGVGLATGELFPDALAAGPLLGANNTVLLLTRTASLNADASAALGAHKYEIDEYHLFGGTAALSTLTRTQTADVLRRTTTDPYVDPHALPDVFCAGSGCHDTDLASIHLNVTQTDGDPTGCSVGCHGMTPISDCTVCHENAHAGSHPEVLSSDGSCTQAGCHSAGALAIHAACTSCHNATTDVTDATCETCHMNPHASIAAHTVANTGGGCFDALCHGTDVTHMHAIDFRGSGEEPPGCSACHAPGVTPSTTCLGACHPVANFGAWHDSTNGHAVIQDTIAASSAGCVSCHGSNLMAIEEVTGEHKACSCHAYGHAAGATSCESCHEGAHAPHVGVHDAMDFAGETSSACVACHGDDLLAVGDVDLHIKDAHAGCVCHAYDELFDLGFELIGSKTTDASECADCHEGAFAPHGFSTAVSLHHQESSVAASGHNTTTFGVIGPLTKFDGSQGVTLMWESEIASATLQPTWIVEEGFQPAEAPSGVTSLTVGQTGVVTTDWDFPTANVFWESDDASAPVDAMFLNANSVVTCEDCHAGLEVAGPHGADDYWGIDPDYPADYSYGELTKQIEQFPSGIKLRSTLTTATQTYTTGMDLICSKCHDLQNYQSGTTANNPLPRISTGDAPFDFGGDTWDPVYIDAVSSRSRGFYVWTRNDGSQVDPADITITGTNDGTHTMAWSSTDVEAQAWFQGVAGTTTASTIGSSNTAHSSHHQDTTDGSAQCVGCHVGIPHGWKSPRLLVNSGWNGTANSIGAGLIEGDRAPYRDPDLLGTTRTNGGILINPLTGFNNMGMLTLSAVDNHNLNAGATLASPYTTGAAYWSEPSCQACNDHAGEDGIRIIGSE